MSVIPSSSGTVLSVGQVAASQPPAVPAVSLPPPPPPGHSSASSHQFVFPTTAPSAQQPSVVTHPALVERYPVVSQLQAYSSIPPPVYSRPRPTATTQGQFTYGMPHVPEFAAAPATNPTDPLQESMVDHLASLMEVVRRQIYWQMQVNKSLINTHQHLGFLWENAILNDSAQQVEDMSPLWSPIQDFPEGMDDGLTVPNNPQEATHYLSNSTGVAFYSSPLAPNHNVPFKRSKRKRSFLKHKRRLCKTCHQRGHASRSCPRRRMNGCHICGNLGHDAIDCTEYMRNPTSLPPQRQAYLQSRRHSSNVASSSGHPPPQTICDLCGQPAHQGEDCEP